MRETAASQKLPLFGCCAALRCCWRNNQKTGYTRQLGWLSIQDSIVYIQCFSCTYCILIIIAVASNAYHPHSSEERSKSEQGERRGVHLSC